MGLRADTLDQIAILLAGMARIALYVVAILLILAPWHIESADMLATVQAAFFGFSVGDVTISLSAHRSSRSCCSRCIGATRALQRWLEVKYPAAYEARSGPAELDQDQPRLCRLVVALALSLTHIGLGFERLTLVAGGLSLGIGLGLQTSPTISCRA